MLDVYEAMRTTRAVRRLRSDPVPDDVLYRVFQAAVYGPSGGNRQPWKLIAVKDAETKAAFQRLYVEAWKRYSEAGRTRLADLPERSRQRAERALAAADYLSEHLHEAPVICVVCFDPRGLVITDAQLDRPSVVGGASIYPAVQNLLLACRAEGLGCVLTTLLCAFEAEIRPLLDLPQDWYTAAFVPIGYPVGGGHGPLFRRAVEEAVYADRWGLPLFEEPA